MVTIRYAKVKGLYDAELAPTAQTAPPAAFGTITIYFAVMDVFANVT